MMHESHLYCKTNVSPRERETLLLVKGTLIKLSLLDKWLSFSLRFQAWLTGLYTSLKITVLHCRSVNLIFVMWAAVICLFSASKSVSLTFSLCWVQHLLTLALNLSEMQINMGPMSCLCPAQTCMSWDVLHLVLDTLPVIFPDLSFPGCLTTWQTNRWRENRVT